MMNPFLSIIVPVYRVEPYLSKCLDSILAQTFQNFELILMDDGSPDNCPQICDDYQEKDARVKVIHKENGGLVSARKAGLKAAVGEYVTYVDSDDWIEQNMYELMCEKAKVYSCDMVICDVIISYEDAEIKKAQMIPAGFYHKKDLIEKVYPYMLYSGTFYEFGLYPAVWNKIFKKDILEKNQYPIDEYIRIGEDAACTYPCLLDADSVFILDHAFLYHYRRSNLSMTKSYDEKYFERILILYEYLRKKNREKNVYDLSGQLYYFLVHLVIGSILNEYETDSGKNGHEKMKFINGVLCHTYVDEALNRISVKGMPKKAAIFIWLLKNKRSWLLHQMILFIRRLQDTKTIQ